MSQENTFTHRSRSRPIHIWSNDDLTWIKTRFAGERSWVEFRCSLPYHEWGPVPSHVSMLHDLLEGWHACILHAGDSFDLLEWHPDYDRVAAFIDIMDRARFPFVRDGRVIE